MKAEVSNKISSYVFMGLMSITAIVLVLFYGVGYDNQSVVTGGSYATDPQFTDLLMFWMYGLLAVGVAGIVVFGLMQFGASLKTNPKGALKSLGALGAMVALFVVAYLFSSTAPIRINNEWFEDATILTITDVCIYVQYVLISVSVVALILSLAGVFKNFNKVKA